MVCRRKQPHHESVAAELLYLGFGQNWLLALVECVQAAIKNIVFCRHKEHPVAIQTRAQTDLLARYQLQNFFCLLKMVQLVGLNPPRGGFHQEHGIVIAVGKESVERQTHSRALLRDFGFADRNDFLLQGGSHGVLLFRSRSHGRQRVPLVRQIQVLQMRRHILALVQDAHHIHRIAGLAPEKYHVRANQVLAIARAYVLCTLAARASLGQRLCQLFAGRMNSQHIGIGLICPPAAIAVSQISERSARASGERR